MTVVYIVEASSGCTDQGNALIFDSVWSTKELAEDYCKERFGDWEHDITAVRMDEEG